MKIIESPTGLKIYHQGPNFEKGPLPALFYFAIGGEETLTKEPFNQPLLPFEEENIHLFSFDLPFHGSGLDNKQAIKQWMEELRSGQDPITPFIEQCYLSIQFLIDSGYVNSEAMAVAGLSRGAFIATHLAARDPRIKIILGFAPLTQFGVSEEVQDLKENPTAKKLSLHKLQDKLLDKELRFYIGNYDTLVGTIHCFRFIYDLTQTIYLATRSFPPIELVVVPSVGYRGHGTLRPTFEDGGNWVLTHLKSKVL